jgi:ribonuclease Z
MAAGISDHIKVTLLGTGTPFPSAERYGTAILVEAGGKKLLFDAGRGVVIRLAEEGVKPSEIDSLFLTHLHSDHVVGLPDLWLTGWFLGRKAPLEVLGPARTRQLADHLIQAFSGDIAAREAPPENLPHRGAEIEAKDIQQGVVYDHGGVKVTAFLVDHFNVKPAFGYRVDYRGHSVAISGDTRFSENLIHFAKGVDCLLHAAWMPNSKNTTPPALRSLASAEDAGRVFEAARPRLAVVYHYKDADGIAEAVKTEYKGPLVIARDLTVIDIGTEVTFTLGPGRPSRDNVAGQ